MNPKSLMIYIYSLTITMILNDYQVVQVLLVVLSLHLEQDHPHVQEDQAIRHLLCLLSVQDSHRFPEDQVNQGFQLLLLNHKLKWCSISQ